MPIVRKRVVQPITHVFADDGNIPNNAWPLVLYRGGIDLAGSPDPEALIEKTFTTNGWGGLWRNGIYPYVHYHSMIHEAMAVARGRATVLQLTNCTVGVVYLALWKEPPCPPALPVAR